ncbi:MAG: alanine dehydrogenase [Anaerolineales bacterium]|jgi:alanine dehydrogenase|nr:alanine dehydrogenase [Anaerolineales bacterium]
MNIGIPKETRAFEYRVGLFPAGVKMLTQLGHTCYVEHDAGLGAGFSDQEYMNAGARIAYTPHEVFGRADLLLKVARPTEEEIDWLRPGSAIAGLLHLGSARKNKIEKLVEKEITAIAYEQIQLPDGTVPIRKPLSAIGGILAAQIGARLLQSNEGGKGILIGGMPGIPPAEVVVIGAGIAGSGAAKAFLRMGAHVTVLDTNISALETIYNTLPGVVTMISNPINIERACAYADIVVAAILVPGERPPIIITRQMLRNMKPRSIIMDISIDEGGCVETSRPTTNEKPTFIEEGIIHYCVPNIPSVVARTSTYAFLNAAMPFIEEIVEKGVDRAIAENPAIEHGVGTYQGKVRHISSLSPLAQME